MRTSKCFNCITYDFDVIDQDIIGNLFTRPQKLILHYVLTLIFLMLCTARRKESERREKLRGNIGLEKVSD